MAVEAVCGACGDVHPLGDRRLDTTTTVCPACGARPYSTRSTGDRITKTEPERIADHVRDVDGVGPKNLAAIQDTFSTLAELRAADRAQLLDVDGVGKETAAGILERG